MPASTVVEYEMGYGADEFGKVLHGPFTGDRTEFNAAEIGRYRWLITLADNAFELEIEVDERPPRELGMFKLPVLAVKFTFTDTEENLRQRFFARFHQYFHKGGG